MRAGGCIRRCEGRGEGAEIEASENTENRIETQKSDDRREKTEEERELKGSEHRDRSSQRNRAV